MKEEVEGNWVVSFVHGYEDGVHETEVKERPALVALGKAGKEIHRYPFPRNRRDFEDPSLSGMFFGDSPEEGGPDFEKLPRFGFTGVAGDENFIYAGSWNAVYKMNRESLALEGIITNRMMMDLHGIATHDGLIYTVLTAKDTVVATNQQGEVVDWFSIGRDLKISKTDDVRAVDWRFISKQMRGTAGYWHFNHIQVVDGKVLLTTRNASAIVEIDLETRNAELRLMNLCTPTLLHDGKLYDGKYYFTSIDGKIIIASASEDDPANKRNWEAVENLKLYNRDLDVRLIRLNETEFGREPNWCRGIAVADDLVVVSVDGRYDSDLSFGVVGLRPSNEEIAFSTRVRWSEVEVEEGLRYVTGFDLTSREWH
jgi:hypothetical protein